MITEFEGLSVPEGVHFKRNATFAEASQYLLPCDKVCTPASGCANCADCIFSGFNSNQRGRYFQAMKRLEQAAEPVIEHLEKEGIPMSKPEEAYCFQNVMLEDGDYVLMEDTSAVEYIGFVFPSIRNSSSFFSGYENKKHEVISKSELDLLVAGARVLRVWRPKDKKEVLLLTQDLLGSAHIKHHCLRGWYMKDHITFFPDPVYDSSKEPQVVELTVEQLEAKLKEAGKLKEEDTLKVVK